MDVFGDKRVERLANERDFGGLIDLLKHGDGNIAAQAATELGWLGDVRAVEPLLSRLRRIDLNAATPEEKKFEWGCLAGALGYLAEAGSSAADELLQVLERPDGAGFRIAAEALAEMGDRRVIEPCLRRLGSIDPSSLTPEDEGDAEHAIDALGTLKAPETVGALIAALEIESMREWTANALGAIGDPRAVPALAALLEPEPPLFVGHAIANALEAIGTPEAKAALAAWEARRITPPDAHEWRVKRLREPFTWRLRRWWARLSPRRD